MEGFTLLWCPTFYNQIKTDWFTYEGFIVLLLSCPHFTENSIIFIMFFVYDEGNFINFSCLCEEFRISLCPREEFHCFAWRISVFLYPLGHTCTLPTHDGPFYLLLRWGFYFIVLPFLTKLQRIVPYGVLHREFYYFSIFSVFDVEDFFNFLCLCGEFRTFMPMCIWGFY